MSQENPLTPYQPDTTDTEITELLEILIKRLLAVLNEKKARNEAELFLARRKFKNKLISTAEFDLANILLLIATLGLLKTHNELYLIPTIMAGCLYLLGNLSTYKLEKMATRIRAEIKKAYDVYHQESITVDPHNIETTTLQIKD